MVFHGKIGLSFENQYERILFDSLSLNRVYGRYAYKHLGMKHDIRTVLAILGVLITVLEVRACTFLLKRYT